MFSRQRTSSVSSGADRAQGRPPLLHPEDRATDMASSNTNGIEKEPKRKSFMGIHFGGHKEKEKEKAGKEGTRLERQSMDQQRTASFTSSPVRNSMSDVVRPGRVQPNQGSNGSPLGNRIVSQPSFPSTAGGRPGNDARSEYQERERSVSLTAAPSGNPSMTAFQGPAGRTTSPRADTSSGQSAMGLQRLQPHRPLSGSAEGEGRAMTEGASQRDMQGGSFAVARRSPSSLDPGPPTAQPQPPTTRTTSQQFLQPHQSPTGSTRPRTISSSSRNGNPALANVLQSYIDLNTIQANKLYASSPPELEMIFARQTNGAQPKKGPPGSIANDWDKIWLQLTGTSLSIWSMKETADAAKRGERIPPTYHNITDSTIELLNPLPAPPHRGTSKPYPFCFSLNTAGSNRILLSCPTEEIRTLFVSALRLSAWEKSRLEEIYTGHLLRTFVSGGRAPVVPGGNDRPNWNEPDGGLVRGKMEGWVRVRVMGTIEWKRLWMVLSSPVTESLDKPATEKKRKSLFSFGGEKREESTAAAGGGVASTRQAGVPDAAPSALFYQEAPLKGKAAKNVAPSEPLLKITHVTQAYAVYPEQTEVIPMSNLLKVTGRISGDLVVVEGRPRLNGWAMIMCEKQEQDTVALANQPIVCDMLRWAIGFHDAFGLYGRPKNYSWDKGDPASLFFGYQDRGPNRLFLETAQAATIDPNLDNIAEARQIYADMVCQRMLEDLQGSRATTPSQYSHTSRDTQRPLANASHSSQNLARASDHSSSDQREQEQENELSSDEEEGQYEDHPSGSQYRTSGAAFAQEQENLNQEDSRMPHRANTLTPITERSDVASRKTSIGTMNTLDRARGLGGSQSSTKGTNPQGSGSGSSHLGRNPSTGTRLVEPMVIEEVMTLSPVGSTQPQLSTEDLISDRVSDSAGSGVPISQEYQPPRDALGLTAGGNTGQPLAEVVAPKPQKPSDTFDEDTVLQDNAYLLDQIALGSPQKDQRHLSPAAMQSEKSPDNLTDHSPSLDRSSRSLLGRKPSGARAMPPKRQVSGASQPSLQSVEDENQPSTPPALAQEVAIPRNDTHHGIAPSPSLNADAMAALTFLDGGSPRPKAEPAAEPVRHVSPDQMDDNKAGYRSSFAPSKAAQDRRARAQEAEKHRDDVRTKPGVRRAPIARRKTDWSASSDEESNRGSESESDEEEAKTSTAPPSRPSSLFDSRSRNNSRNNLPQAASQNTLGRANGRPLPTPADAGRVPRNLPPIPGSRATSAAHPDARSRPGTMTENNRSASWAYQEPPQYAQTSGQNSPLSSSVYNSGDDLRPAPSAYRPPPRTSNMWNSDLDAPHLGLDPNDSQKFVQLEKGNAQMTKAFTPHGLLQAGLQDKEDRSAKRQEENAKESGSSLVNVPNKPPPPQAGLLGAITAHERDRKAPGGIGAALTERERDRRLAEERQRQIDDLQMLQRQTMFGQTASPGAEFARPMSAYGGSQAGMAYPMQMNNPSMMWGMANPYAAQAMMAANMAYQNSLYMAMSTAGSQYGGGTPGVGGDSAARATSPMMMPPMMSPASPYMLPSQMPPGMNMGYPGYPWGMPPAPPSTMMPAPTGQTGPSPNATGQGKGEQT